MRTRDGVNLALKALGLGGLAATVIVAPNATQAVAKLIRSPSASPTDYQKIMRELKRQRLIVMQQHDSSYDLSLTPAGAHRLQNLIVDNLEIPKPKQWDHQWRIVTFDIPVKMSRERHKFTALLQQKGFYMLQRSLWLHPYPCFDQVEQIAGHFNILRYVTLIEARRFDSITTRRLVKHFESLLAD